MSKPFILLKITKIDSDCTVSSNKVEQTLPDFTGLHWTSPDFTGLHRTSPNFTGLHRTSPDFTGLHRTISTFALQFIWMYTSCEVRWHSIIYQLLDNNNPLAKFTSHIFYLKIKMKFIAKQDHLCFWKKGFKTEFLHNLKVILSYIYIYILMKPSWFFHS